MKKLIGIIIGLVMIVSVGCYTNSNTNSSSDNTKSTSTAQGEKKEDNVPTEYQNALETAYNYSESCNLSKKGIYDQLVGVEKFPKEAAQYAIDNMDVNWKENALKTAESYSETCNMSKSSIYDQLIRVEGFTEKQAQYAVDNMK